MYIKLSFYVYLINPMYIKYISKLYVFYQKIQNQKSLKAKSKKSKNLKNSNLV